jgi:urea transport system ATP-binding protein
MLQIENIQQYYGGSHILRGVSLEAKAGEVTVVLGRNGVGKTTLLKALMGLVPIKGGSVRFNGQAIDKTTPYERARAGIGYVPQGREIFARLTVQENLLMGLATQKAGTPIPPQLYELFPIARALAPAPRVLVLDEPTEGIQPNIIKDIGRVIKQLAQTGMNGQPMAIVLVEQYYDFAEALADRYVVMDRGEVVASGPGSEMAAKGVRQLVAI